MAKRRADVVWEKDLIHGSGRVRLASKSLAEFPVTWASRTEEPQGKTSPEELLAAAQASCYAMALSATLSRKGTPPSRLNVSAEASFDRVGEGFKVTTMAINVVGNVPGIDQAKFQEIAREAERGCPIANAIRNNVQIALTSRLEN